MCGGSKKSAAAPAPAPAAPQGPRDGDYSNRQRQAAGNPAPDTFGAELGGAAPDPNALVNPKLN